MNNNKGHAWLVVVLAVAFLVILSMLPWSDMTSGFIKDFNLFGDILKSESPTTATATELIDPELELALADDDEPNQSTDTSTADSKEEPDTLAIANIAAEVIAPREGDVVLIEDYTPDARGLQHFKSKLAQGSDPVRVAVIGDSYIEGDILTMDLRRALQDRFGGKGVGYMPMDSPHTGFRTSVRQTSNGWAIHDIRKTKDKSSKWLSGEYFTAENGAKTTFKGTAKRPHLADWSRTELVYIAPADGTITITTDAGAKDFPVTASSDVAVARVDGKTAKAEITTTVPGLTVLGAFLDGNTGVAVDNMSLRGNSGVSHRDLNTDLAAQMRPFVDYDLIIVEYGINALSSQQTDYTAYGRLMQKVIARIRACYPQADILMLGIGDRGQKLNGEVKSIPTAQAMVNAQRQTARNSGILFWDTREAMGGENSIVTWRENKMVNADYIHLNAKGGEELASRLAAALQNILDKQ